MVMRNRQTLGYMAPIIDWIEIENPLDVLATQTISDLKPEVEMLKKEKEQAEKRNKVLREALRVTRKEKRDAEKRKEELQEALRAAKKEKEEAEEQRNRVENMNRELQEALRAAVQKCWELNTRLGDSLEAQRMLKEQLAGMIPIRLQGEAGGTTGASKRGFLASIPWNKYREAVEEYKHSHRNPKER
jgi:transcriptional regulator of acetoin/glycerol metabolism